MERAAARLKERGVRAFRMDQRGCGASRGLSRRLYHAGCSNDLARAVETIAELCPGSKASVVGYSLGGNIVLKLAGESPDLLPRNVVSVMAINPAIDLAETAASLQKPANRFYHRNFLKFAVKLAAALPAYSQRSRSRSRSRILPCFRSLDEFNTFLYTKMWKFGSLARYYEVCSSRPHLAAIRVPTLIVASVDDPIVPIQSFCQVRLSSNTQLVVTEKGGHLGFIGKARPADLDHFWIDWRVLEWVQKSGLSTSAGARECLLCA